MSKTLTDMVSPAKQLKEFNLNKSPLLESIGKHIAFLHKWRRTFHLFARIPSHHPTFLLNSSLMAASIIPAPNFVYSHRGNPLASNVFRQY